MNEQYLFRWMMIAYYIIAPVAVKKTQFYKVTITALIADRL